MAVPRRTLWPLQSHTQTKHEILRRYLEAWLPIMATCNGRIVFIDGFAGPGRYSKGEPGSPLIALEALLGHPHFRQPRRGRQVVFAFIEERPDRVRALTGELNRLALPGWVRVAVYEGRFDQHMTALLDAIESGGGRLAPTFAFLDPFGPSGIPLRLVERIVGHPRCECLISFMYESINRFLSHPAMETHLDDLFGTGAWRDLVELGDANIRKARIVALYRLQLQHAAGLRYVRTFEMINEGNRTEYYLFFGTNNPTGLSRMKRAMWSADPVSGEVFSDRSDENQMVLLQAGAEAGLRRALQKEFRGRGFVPIEELQRFVLEDTPYSESMHLKRRTLAPMERDSQVEVKAPSTAKRRTCNYPPGTTIRFL